MQNRPLGGRLGRLGRLGVVVVGGRATLLRLSLRGRV